MILPPRNAPLSPPAFPPIYPPPAPPIIPHVSAPGPLVAIPKKIVQARRVAIAPAAVSQDAPATPITSLPVSTYFARRHCASRPTTHASLISKPAAPTSSANPI